MLRASDEHRLQLYFIIKFNTISYKGTLKSGRYFTEAPMLENSVQTEASSSNETQRDEIAPVKNNQVKKTTKKPPLCWFYSNFRSCKFRENCKYRHSSPKKIVAKSSINNQNSTNDEKLTSTKNGDAGFGKVASHTSIEKLTENADQDPAKVANKEVKKSENVRKRACIYFRKSKGCKFGDNCNFAHDQGKEFLNQYDADLRIEVGNHGERSVEVIDDNKVSAELNNKTKPQLYGRIQTKNIPLKSLNEEVIASLRDIEITQLKKRFRGKRMKDFDNRLIVMVKATDPDWPFDVKSIWVDVEIPHQYPKELLKLKVKEDQNELLPHLLIKHLNFSIDEWIVAKFTENEKHNVTELVFRPFLRWFDRNMEKLFEEGLKIVKKHHDAKAAGIEFVSHKDLNRANENIENDGNEIIDEVEEVVTLKKQGYDDENYKPENSEVKSVCLQLCNLSNTSETRASIPVDDTKHQRGTAIKVIDFHFSENVAILICSKMFVMVQCTRCRTRCEIGLTPRKPQKSSCLKCNRVMTATFRPTMLHQYSVVMGYFDLEGCKAFDVVLLTCQFSVTCLNCNKSTTITGLSNGQVTNTFCYICHHKLAISLNTFKFQVFDEALSSSEIDKKLIKKKKELKDPAIQDGKPLPDHGTCKHYKRSYRWLRFPCCGKCYPCDVCHDEKETDHEMKFAVRMICGYCCKEQTFSSDKICIRCHSDLTKKSHGHWDNGKGCRNKVKMSKDDKQKYSGLSKTVAKKVEDKRVSKKNK